MKKLLFLVAVAIMSYGLKAQNTGCYAYFTYTVDSSGTTVTFTDMSYTADSSTIISWHWDFGDGTTADVQNPVHTYDTQGTYNVCLTIHTDNGDSSTYCDYVDAMQDPCEGFSVSGVVTNESVYGANDGTIDITVNGGTAPYSYSWSNGSVNEDLFGLASGSYCVTVTDINGCTAIDCFDIYPDSANDFVDTLTTSTIDTCFNFTVDSAYVSGYQWIDQNHVEITWVFQGSETSVTITATYEIYQNQGGNNYIVLISIDCGSKSVTTYSDEVYIDEFSGILEQKPDISQLRLYPNPASEYINISLKTNTVADIAIYNATGQLVRKINSSKTKVTRINISGLRKGVYIVKVKAGNSVMTGRFTK